MTTNYDVIIVGAGPAGIFAALELARSSKLSILILDKGKSIAKRSCPIRSNNMKCIHCNPCDLLCGWGGAGAFSDGKLTLSTDVGGQLTKFIPVEELRELIAYSDKIYLRFGANKEVYGEDEEEIKALQRKAAIANLTLIPGRIRHLGTEKSAAVMQAIEDDLKAQVDIAPRTEVKELLINKGKVAGVRTAKGDFKAKYVIVAPGRQGSSWLTGEARRLKLKTLVNPVDVGVRVEMPAVTAEPLTKGVYESKFIFYSKHFDDQVRTFCMCPYGEVTTEFNDGIITVNGHSYSDTKTDNTNFALLVSKTFTDPFKDPIAYGQYIARLANLLSGGVIVQRLGDLEFGRRSTEERLQKSIVNHTLKSATPGDLSLVLPYRHLSSILEMLKALDVVAPGTYSRHTLLYGIEVKFYSSQLEVNNVLETEIPNVFAAGDGAGITRGLMQASASGILVAREILKRSGLIR